MLNMSINGKLFLRFMTHLGNKSLMHFLNVQKTASYYGLNIYDISQSSKNKQILISLQNYMQ